MAQREAWICGSILNSCILRKRLRYALRQQHVKMQKQIQKLSQLQNRA